MRDLELKWIVQKASELLHDKAAEKPLDEDDIELAFSIFAESRLAKISKSFESREEYEEAVDWVKEELRNVANELNEEHWSSR